MQRVTLPAPVKGTSVSESKKRTELLELTSAATRGRGKNKTCQSSLGSAPAE